MPPRKAAKKGKKAEKRKELQKHWDLFQNQCQEYETRLNSFCNNTCDKLRKMYADKLKCLPENVRNMTMAEYMEYQKNVEEETEKNHKQDLRQDFEKTRLMSEKKKTLKKARREERKRSLSVSVVSTSKVSLQPGLMSRVSRVLSESNLSTPLSKRSVAPSFAITPKFNPKVPINKNHLRRPRVGEIVMSLCGSPLQNFTEDIPDRPSVSLSLGGGKVIKITEDTEITKLESDFAKKLDEDTKQTLANVKKKLDQILQA